MTLQQLRYMIKVAESTSLGVAAGLLHISQPSLSVAIRNLEQELGRELFRRSPAGMSLTLDGLELLGYARQLLQQVDAIEHHFRQDSGAAVSFSISTQHYTFIADAFILLMEEFAHIPYAFNFRETTTSGIIEDVQKGYSELGVLFCSSFNQRIMRNIFEDNSLTFKDIIWQRPHILLGRNHPLAIKEIISPEELSVYPSVIYDRGRGTSSFFAEDVLCERPLKQSITVTDRGTMAMLLRKTHAYNIGIGIAPGSLGSEIVSIPLKTDEYIRVVYIRRKDFPLSGLASRFVEALSDALDVLAPGIPPEPDEI